MDNEDKAELLNLIYEIPVIGPLISQVLLLAVPGVILVAFALLLGDIFTEVFGGAVMLLVASAALLWWVNFFERRIGIRMLLPLPIVNIPWSWVARLGIVSGVALAFMSICGW